MFSVVPTRILYDTSITPQAKTALLILYDRVKTNKINLKHFNLAEDMKYGEQMPPEEYIDQLIVELVAAGYVKRNNNTVTLLVDTLREIPEAKKASRKPRVNEHEEEAKEVLSYISESRIARGYSTRALTSKQFIDIISDRMRDGATKEECITVVNYAFLHDDYLSKNPKYLLPSTLFRKSNFPKYLADAERFEGVENQVITETGFTVQEEEGETIAF